ncbi:MAG: CinA family nicotinamide mononucleotide deamidase-related protein [Fibrobacterota bacterium]|nr:CinA family nicotinamide mononucleotide deamidase-related protein [Fibrobacterota bacterium]QQS04635.1 MAG: CinA family nicotinamide mononucleotide deamidase-related protein [Fibrobacterota bacterium]
MNQDVVIVAVADEILQSRRTETNAAWLSRRLFEAGVPLSEVRVVSDTPGALADTLQSLRKKGRTVVSTGGMGPTRDDRTRSESAAAFGRNLTRSDEALAQVRARYEKLGRPMDESAFVQADIPEGSRVVFNPQGTAPCFLVEEDGFRHIALPGVPREVRAVWDHSLGALLSQASDQPGIRRLFTHGLGESEQETRMSDLALDDIEFCSLPGFFGVEIQCLARGEGDRDARAAAALELVAQRLGSAVVRPLGSNLVESLQANLRGRGWKVFFAESCTAGLAAAEMASLPGISDVLTGGVVAYANEVKMSLLGVSPETLRDHGAVSRETALEMARGASRLCGGGLGLSVTGVAGPDGGTAEKPVGLVWIAQSSPEGESAVELRLLGERDEIRRRAAWRLIGLGWSVTREI